MAIVFTGIDPAFLNPQKGNPRGDPPATAKAAGIIGNITYLAAQAGAAGNSITVNHVLVSPVVAAAASASLGGLTYTATSTGASGNNITVTANAGASGSAGTATLSRAMTPSGTASFSISEKPEFYGSPTSVKFVCSDIGSDIADFTQFPSSVSGGDAEFNNVTLLLNGNGNGGTPHNRFFVDSAYNTQFEAPITNSKRVTQGSFSPFSKNTGEWSAYLPSYNRSASVNTNSLLVNGTTSTGNIGTDFTFECWFNGGPSTYGVIAGKTRLANDANDCWYASVVSASGLFVFTVHHTTNQTKSFSSVTRVDDNKWHHLALVKQGTSYSVYVDGILESTEQFGTVLNSSTSHRITVGGTTLNSGDFGRTECHLSNLRITNTAVYTGAFSVPTSPLSAISGTILLTCRDNRIYDAGPNNYAMEIQQGMLAAQPFSPFTNTSTLSNSEAGGSVIFHNDNNENGYIEVANSANLSLGTGNFTIESWFYLTAETYNQWVNDNLKNATIYACYATSSSATPSRTGSDLKIVGNATSTGLGLRFTNYVSGAASSIEYVGTIKTNCWYHVAVVRNGTTTTIFLNGTAVASGTLAQQNIAHASPLRIGMTPDAWYRHPFNGFISNFRIVKGTPVYTGNFTPPTTALTAVSGTAVLTCNGSQMADQSATAAAVTTTNHAAIASFTPFQDYGSVVFDGYSGMTIADNAAFHLPGDFTIEAWINPSTVSSTQSICGHWPGGVATNCSFLMQITSTARLQLSYGIGSTNLAVTATSTTITKGVWNHVAITRSGSTVRFYVNGVLDSNTPTVAGQLNNSTGSFTIGFANATDQQYFLGSISNLRIVKDAALYSTTFTPATSKLTAVSGTSLLTCQSPYLVDASQNNLAITPGTSVAIRPANPFSSTPSSAVGSGFFNGASMVSYATGRRILDPGLGDFAIEAWIYPLNWGGSSAGEVIFSKYGYNNNGYMFTMLNGGASNSNRYTGIRFQQWAGAVTIGSAQASTSIPKNSWHHVAVSRSGATIRFFVDGVLVGSDNNWGSVNITSNSQVVVGATAGASNNLDQPFTGHISGLRMTKGNAIYSSNFTPSSSSTSDATGVTFLMNFANGSIIDNTNNFVLEPAGSFALSTVSPKFGSRSMLFNGTDAGLDISAIDNDFLDHRLQLGRKDFTIEGWINPSTSMTSKFIYYAQFNQAEYYVIMSSGNISFQRMGVSVVTSTTTIALNQWTHFAVSRSSGSTKLYINGILEASTSVAYNFGVDFAGSALRCSIGYRRASPSGTYFSGYIDDFRLTIGKDRYPTPTVARSLLGSTETISFPTGTTVSQILAVVGPSGTNQSSRVVITSASSGTLWKNNPSPNPGVTTSGGSASESLAVSIAGTNITIRIAGGGSTASQVKAALDANASVTALVSVSNPVGNASAFAQTNLAGGTDAAPAVLSVAIVGDAVTVSIPENTSATSVASALNANANFAGLVLATASDADPALTSGNVTLTGGIG